MTEPVKQAVDASIADAQTSVYSKDYWDNVFEQVGRRPMVKFAIAVLALLYASAIYAPLIANDRPYVLEATDYKGYEKAQKTLYAGAASLRVLVKNGEEKFLERLSEDATIRTYSGAMESERGSLIRNLDSMRAALADEHHARLDALQTKADEVIQLATGRDRDTALAAAEELKDEAKAIRKDYVAVDPEKPDEGGMTLSGQKSYPLFEATTAGEMFFYVLWFLVLTWPLWNRLINSLLLKSDKEAVRTWRKRKLFAALGLSFVSSLLWSVLVGGEMTHESADYKHRLTSGELVASNVVWPPVTMGFAETHAAECFRHPTWYSLSEIDDEGFYVRGPRAVRVDEATGVENTAKPVEIRTSEPERNSSLRHPLGTDSLGRDLFVRILYGGRISLAVGILSTVLLVFFGVVMGSLAGYFGGWVDIVISRIIEIFQSIPAFFLILSAVSMIPDEVIKPIFAIVFFMALVRWTGIARLVRAEFFRLKEQEFVIAAQALGFKNRRIIFGHVLPNALGPVLVAAAFSVAAGILTESAISFLGLGIKLPIPSWGSLLNEARGVAEYWWLQIFPGVLIFVTVFCYNIVGEGVRDALDPRRKV